MPREKLYPTREAYGASIEERFPGMLELLGNSYYADIGARYGISKQRVHQIAQRLGLTFDELPPKHTIPKEVWAGVDPLLGTMSDREIGRRSGLSSSSVRKRRNHLGVAPFVPDLDIPLRVESVRHRMGVDSDRLLAVEIGVSAGTIRKYRDRWGIEPVWTGRWCGPREEG